MELDISDKDAEVLSLNTYTKERITSLVHSHIGSASEVSVKIVEKPDGVLLETGTGTIIIDRTLTKKIN